MDVLPDNGILQGIQPGEAGSLSPHMLAQIGAGVGMATRAIGRAVFNRGVQKVADYAFPATSRAQLRFRNRLQRNYARNSIRRRSSGKSRFPIRRSRIRFGIPFSRGARLYKSRRFSRSRRFRRRSRRFRRW